MCKQKFRIINHKMKIKLDVFLSTCTPIKYINKTPFMENPSQNVNKNYKRCFEFESEMRLKIKWITFLTLFI
jgi:hypothetical protein